MGNCHSKSDDHRAGDGYSSSTEKLNPRPVYAANPNHQIVNNIYFNQPLGGRATGKRQRIPSQPQPQQRLGQQQQFSAPATGKRQPNPKPEPEYRLKLSCSTCKRYGDECVTAKDMNNEGTTFYRNPQYDGDLKDWKLEVDFCSTLNKLLATRERGMSPAERQRYEQKGKPKSPEWPINKFIKYHTVGAEVKDDKGPHEVEKLVKALQDAEVEYWSSLHGSWSPPKKESARQGGKGAY
jgi:hypothetical protein